MNEEQATTLCDNVLIRVEPFESIFFIKIPTCSTPEATAAVENLLVDYLNVVEYDESISYPEWRFYTKVVAE